MVDNLEEEETDRDADSLKSPMAAYLKAVDAAIKTYGLDQAEFEKIYNRLNADYAVIQNLNSKMSSHLSNLKNLNIYKTDAIGIINDAFRARQ